MGNVAATDLPTRPFHTHLDAVAVRHGATRNRHRSSAAGDGSSRAGHRNPDVIGSSVAWGRLGARRVDADGWAAPPRAGGPAIPQNLSSHAAAPEVKVRHPRLRRWRRARHCVSADDWLPVVGARTSRLTISTVKIWTGRSTRCAVAATLSSSDPGCVACKRTGRLAIALPNASTAAAIEGRADLGPVRDAAARRSPQSNTKQAERVSVGPPLAHARKETDAMHCLTVGLPTCLHERGARSPPKQTTEVLLKSAGK